MQNARPNQNQAVSPLMQAAADTAAADTRPSPPCPHRIKVLTELATLARQVI